MVFWRGLDPCVNYMTFGQRNINPNATLSFASNFQASDGISICLNLRFECHQKLGKRVKGSVLQWDRCSAAHRLVTSRYQWHCFQVAPPVRVLL